MRAWMRQITCRQAVETSLKVLRMLAVVLVAGLAAVDGRGTVDASGSRFTTIDDPHGVKGTSVYGINARGDIVGTYTDRKDITHGFLLHHGRYTTIDDPHGVTDSYTSDINSQGDIVGFYVDARTDHTSGFLLRRGRYTSIDVSHSVLGTDAHGINSQGDIVGTYTDPGGKEHGFLLHHG